MKKRGFLFTILLLVVAVVQLSAQPGPGRKWGARHFMTDEPGPDAIMGKLNLTPDQEKKFQELRLKQEKEMLPLQNDLRSVQLDLKGEMLADKPNQDKVNGFIEKAGKIRIDMQKKRFAHRQTLRGLLTDEQKAIWDQNKGRFWEECQGLCGHSMGRPGRGMKMQHRHWE